MRLVVGLGPLAAAVVAAAVACGAPPLTNGEPSAEGLAQQILEALARRDAPGLRALAVSEPEFKAYVWPDLPASRPERNLPFSYVWGDLAQKSDASFHSTFRAHGGRRYDLVGVAFDDPPTDYPGFRIHRQARLVVREADGTRQELRLCGSFLERDGRWKVLSFVVDD